MSVTAAHIEAATAILGQIAFSGGEDADPGVTLAAWRAVEGIEEGALEAAAHESALDSIREIEEVIADGGAFTTGTLMEYIEREFMTAWQVGWITRARAEKRAKETAAK